MRKMTNAVVSISCLIRQSNSELSNVDCVNCQVNI